MNTQGGFSFGGNGRGPLSGIAGVIIAVLFFIGLFWFMQVLFRILWFLLPVMVIATAIINYKVLFNYFGWLGRLFRSNWIAGAGMGALTLIGAPVVALFLLGRALLGRKIKSVQEEMERQHQPEFTEYEEIESETLDLPELERPEPQSRNRNKEQGYEDLFE